MNLPLRKKRATFAYFETKHKAKRFARRLIQLKKAHKRWFFFTPRSRQRGDEHLSIPARCMAQYGLPRNRFRVTNGFGTYHLQYNMNQPRTKDEWPLWPAKKIFYGTLPATAPPQNVLPFVIQGYRPMVHGRRMHTNRIDMVPLDRFSYMGPNQTYTWELRDMYSATGCIFVMASENWLQYPCSVYRAGVNTNTAENYHIQELMMQNMPYDYFRHPSKWLRYVTYRTSKRIGLAKLKPKRNRPDTLQARAKLRLKGQIYKQQRLRRDRR